MSRVFNKLYLESFKNTPDDDTEDSDNDKIVDDDAEDSDNIEQDTDNEDNDTGGEGDEEGGNEDEEGDEEDEEGDEEDEEGDEEDEEGDEEGDDDEKNEDEQSVGQIRKENIKNSNLDEQDDDELDEMDNEKDRLLNDEMEEDEMDDDELTDQDIDNLLDQKFPDNPNQDARDDEVFIAQKINILDLKNDPNLDEKLDDMDINDDDDEDNLFAQGGANGERAQGMVNQIEREGDELAQLLLEVPIAVIMMSIEITLTLVGAILEVPINKVDEYLEPIRSALKRLYSLVLPIVLLINNIVGLPFAIGSFAWATLCNILKLFGVNVSCRANYEPSTYIIRMFEAITNINPFRFKDIVFNESFRNQLFDAVRVFVQQIIYTFVLIIKAISIIAKIIEGIIAGIKATIEVIRQITSKTNLLGFLTVLIMLSVFYLSFYGMNKITGIFNLIKEKFFNSN
jgi:hypothetical protein